MPLLFKKRNPTNARDKLWFSLDISERDGLLVWKHGMSEPIYSGTAKTITEQVTLILKEYQAFKYLDMNVTDGGHGLNMTCYSRLLNERGDVPDFTQKTSERGWLSPNGDFIGCGYGSHADLLQFTLGVGSDEAKRDGWIMIQPDAWLMADKGKTPNTAQLETLNVLGFVSQQNRTEIPAYTEYFENIRQLYLHVSDAKNIPTPVPAEEVHAAVKNLPIEIKKMYSDSLNATAGIGIELMRGASNDFAKISEINSRVNAILLRGLDGLSKTVVALKF